MPEGFDLDLEHFLAGDQEVDEDDIFAKNFSVVITDMMHYDPKGIEWTAKDAPFPSLIASGYCYRHVDAGVLLFCPEGILVGGYLSCDVAIDIEHQGQGLGKELVIERCLKDGMNPVLNLDTASYSSAGLAAHTSAWHHARTNLSETHERMKRISDHTS